MTAPTAAPLPAPVAPMTKPEPRVRLRDNPLLVAQARRRLRPRQMVPGMIVILLLGLCGLLFASSARGASGAWNFLEGMALFGLGYLLFLRGVFRIGSTVSTEQNEGLVDFHRATPTTPWTDAVGYLLGVPAREYALAGLILPFLFFGSLGAGHDLGDVLTVVFLYILSGWLYHAFALTAGLVTRKPWGAATVSVVIVLFVFMAGSVFHEVGLDAFAYLTPYPAVAALVGHGTLFSDAAAPVLFFGAPIPSLLYAVVLQGYLLAFLLWGAARKLRARSMPVFSRPGALVFVGIAVFLLVGSLWSHSPAAGAVSLVSDMRLAVLGGLLAGTSTGVGTFVLILLTPSYLDVLRAVRRARKRGRTGPQWLADGGTLWPMALLFGAIVSLGLVVFAAGASRSHQAASVFSPSLLLAIAAIVAFLAFIATAAEWVRLAARRSYRSVALLVAFLTLMLPWILAGIVGVSGVGARASVGPWVAAFSPTYALIASFLWLSATWGSAMGFVDELHGSLFLSLGVTVALALGFGVALTAIRKKLTNRRRRATPRPAQPPAAPATPEPPSTHAPPPHAPTMG